MGNVKTIGSISIARSSRDCVYVQIEDEHSGDSILEMAISLHDFGLLLTGLGGIKGEMTFNKNAHIAEEREVKVIIVPEIGRYGLDKNITRQLVEKHFEDSKLSEDGWEITNDGTGSQQNNKAGYCYTIKRYVPVKSE
jgi:hypothetical protein